MATPWLQYANQGATRNLPLDNDLAQALSYLQDLGVTAKVFSGGQPEKGSGLARIGSTRHDHGNAADVFFYQGDRKLDWSNPDDVPVFQEIVKRGKAAGLTGFGAGPGYMQPGAMHVGFGNPGVWGAGGKSANAPDWLRSAFGEAVAQAQPQSTPSQPQNNVVPGSMSPSMPPLDPPRDVATMRVTPVQERAAANPMPAGMPPPPTQQQPSQGSNMAQMMALLGSMSPQQQTPAPQPVVGPSPEQANALSSLVAALRKGGLA